MALPSQHESGRELASLNWLIDHHEAKKSFRKEIVERFALRPGDTIVDLGCGPGLWTFALADAVGSTGIVKAYDIAGDFIDFARSTNVELMNEGRADFTKCDVANPPNLISNGDVVLLMNTLGYFQHSSAVLKSIWQLMKSDARLIVRQFDIGATLFSAVTPTLQARIYSAALEAVSSRTENLNNPVLGRHLHRLFREVGIETFESTVDAVLIQSPLSDGARRYLGAKAQWFGHLASASASDEDLKAWSETLPTCGRGGGFEELGFTFSTLEYQVEAKKYG